MLRGGLSSVKGGQQEKDLRDFEDGDHPGERLGVGGIRFMAFGVVEGHAAQDQDREEENVHIMMRAGPCVDADEAPVVSCLTGPVSLGCGLGMQFGARAGTVRGHDDTVPITH